MVEAHAWDWGDGPGRVVLAARQVVGVTVGEVKRRDGVVVVGRVQGVVGGVDLGVIRPGRIAGEVADVAAAALVRRVARVCVEHRPPVQLADRRHVDGMGDQVDVDVIRRCADVDGHRLVVRTASEIGGVAGRAVDHRHGGDPARCVVEVRDVDGAVGVVGKDPERS